MNPDKPSHEDPHERQPKDPSADAIPRLDAALDPTQAGVEEVRRSPAVDTAADHAASDTAIDIPYYEETAMELSVNLGYAPDSAEEADNLADMEEIQTLPLAEMVLDEAASKFAPGNLDDEQKRQIATLEAIVFEGDDPTAPAPRYPPAAPESAAADVQHEPEPPVAVPDPATAQPPKPLPKKSENPFLPQHILDRLNQGKRNLVEEIAQSSAALDASTAILRTHARAERLHRPAYTEAKPQQYSFARDKSALQKQKLVDDLVEEYLPLIAAELRRRLRRILDE